MQDVLEVLASPRRREILRLVWDGELPAGEIASHFRDVTWATISQNLRVLREAGLVTERREGNWRFYRADRRALGSLRKVLQEMWETDLRRLRAAAAAERRRR
ncbi:MAG: metalloregulator ArsR/SmtB family transcription factor [Actinomycetota bacterium]